MRLLIVAVPCVCCCRGSRHYSTSAWHQCLFQFHLIALVIKPGTDTTHHIIALITSELRCVHMTISLTQTSIPSLRPRPSVPLHSAPALFSPTDLTSSFIRHAGQSRCLYRDKLHSLYSDSFSEYFPSLICKIIHPLDGLFGWWGYLTVMECNVGYQPCAK